MATTDQIVDTAVELGEQKSWEAVRLHDVAAVAGQLPWTMYAPISAKKRILSMPGLSVPIAPCSRRRKYPIFSI